MHTNNITTIDGSERVYAHSHEYPTMSKCEATLSIQHADFAPGQVMFVAEGTDYADALGKLDLLLDKMKDALAREAEELRRIGKKVA